MIRTVLIIIRSQYSLEVADTSIMYANSNYSRISIHYFDLNTSSKFRKGERK